MKALKTVLVVLGVLCFLSSAPATVLPWSGIVRGLEGLGLQAPVGDAFVVYCVRLSSLAFALIGIFFLILASDPRRYRPMLVLAVCGLWLMAAAALVTGWLAQMQPRWYLKRILHYVDPHYINWIDRPMVDSRNAGFSGPQRYLKPSWAGPLHNRNTRDSLGDFATCLIAAVLLLAFWPRHVEPAAPQ